MPKNNMASIKAPKPIVKEKHRSLTFEVKVIRTFCKIMWPLPAAEIKKTPAIISSIIGLIMVATIC